MSGTQLNYHVARGVGHLPQWSDRNHSRWNNAGQNAHQSIGMLLVSAHYALSRLLLKETTSEIEPILTRLWKMDYSLLSNSYLYAYDAHGSAVQDKHSRPQHLRHQKGSSLAAALDSAHGKFQFHLLLLGGFELLSELLELGLVIVLDHAERSI